MNFKSIKLSNGEAFCESSGNICITNDDCSTVSIKYSDLIAMGRAVEDLRNKEK